MFVKNKTRPSQRAVYGTATPRQVFFIDWPLSGVAPLDGRHDVETAPLQDFPQGTDRAARLAEPDVEGPGCGRGADDDGPLAFVQWEGDTSRAFAHQAVDHAVEKHFERARHVAPIAGCADDQRVAVCYLLQRPLCVVFREDTLQPRAACHATRARAHRQVCDADSLHVGSFLCGFPGHGFQHEGDVAVRARAGVEDKDAFTKFFHVVNSVCDRLPFAACVEAGVDSVADTYEKYG